MTHTTIADLKKAIEDHDWKTAKEVLAQKNPLGKIRDDLLEEIKTLNS